MKFIDEAKIFVKAGNGGKGCESFYRLKYMRFPRPNGGDGGRGGDVALVADHRLHTLQDYKFKQHYQAENGGNASSNRKKGKDGHVCQLRVPMGTIVRDFETGLLIKDLVDDGQSVAVVKGGEGGFGNAGGKKTSPPEAGEERTIKLELKVIADVGIIGFPNAGKSTLISAISKVHSKVAGYPFTTKQPILGYVFSDQLEFVVADLPGIIEGAHQGKGLGDRFLKHAERTKILVHVIDMAATEGRDPLDDFEKVNYEIEQYGEVLREKKRIVVANKIDLSTAKQHLKRFKEKYNIDLFLISAVEKQGLEKLKEEIVHILCLENSLNQ